MGALTERAFKRMAESGEVELCFGLVGVHYFLSGKVPFETLIERGSLSVMGEGEENNPFLRNIKVSSRQKQQKEDPWATAYQSDFPNETIDIGKPDSSFAARRPCRRVITARRSMPAPAAIACPGRGIRRA